jgi:hypothetical protein
MRVGVGGVIPMKRAYALALAAALSGCTRLPAETVVVRTADARGAHAPTRADHVELVLGTSPSRAYAVLGIVAVESHFHDDPPALLRAGAARLGADAVIRVRLERVPGGVATRGIAIAYIGESR